MGIKSIAVSVTTQARPYTTPTGNELLIYIKDSQRTQRKINRLVDKIEEIVWEVLGEDIIDEDVQQM